MLPSNAILDSIRALRGKPRVTFPGANLDVRKVERIASFPKDNWQVEYYTPDQDAAFADCLLVTQEKIKEDDKYVEVYRAFQTLPGVLLEATRTDPDTGDHYMETRQLIRATESVPENGGGLVWDKEPIDDVVSILVCRDFSALIGLTFPASYPDISYTFPGLLIHRGGTLSSSNQASSYRPAFSRIIRSKQETLYTAAELDYTDDLFTWLAVSVLSDGRDYGEVLHNVRDAIVGGRRRRVAESEPSSLDYPQGDEVLIRAPSVWVPSRALYRTELTWIKLL